MDSSVKSKNSDILIDKIIDFWYTPKYRTIFLLSFLTLVGFFFRLLAALHLDVLADDMLYASQSTGILSAKILSTHSNPPLFFYLTDVAYSILGYTTLASRFWPLIFGTLLIPLSFILSRKFFNERTALLISLFVAFSNFLIKMTFTEQTLVVLFFSIFAIFCGLEYWDNQNKIWIMFSGILFGLAFLTKYSAPFFLLSFLIFTPFYAKSKSKKLLTKEAIGAYFLLACIILLFSLPFISFNYFLYKDKQIVDVYFSRVIHVEKAQELYQNLAGQDASFFQNLENPQSYMNFTLPFKTDLVLSLFALLGIFLCIRRKEYLSLKFVIISILTIFIFQSAGSTLQKHFAFMLFFLSMPAGYALDEVLRKAKSKKIIVLGVILLMLITTIFLVTYGTPAHIFLSSPNSQLKSIINSQVTQSDLIVFDQRIYTAQVFWLATPNHFLDLGNFVQIYTTTRDVESLVSIDVYFVECVIDDCGWGTIRHQTDLNTTSEEFFNNIKKSAVHIVTVSDQTNILSEKNEVFSVYKAQIELPSYLLQQIDTNNIFYFTPYFYKNKKDFLFSYTIYDSFGNILSKASYGLILLSLFCALLSIFVLWRTLKMAFKH